MLPRASSQLAKLPTRKYSVTASMPMFPSAVCLSVDFGKPDDALGGDDGGGRGHLSGDAEAEDQQAFHRTQQPAALEPVRRLRLTGGRTAPTEPSTKRTS